MTSSGAPDPNFGFHSLSDCARLPRPKRSTLKALIETSTKRTERVFLVGLELKSRSSLDLQDSLAELSELAATAGAEVVGNGIQKLEAPVAGTFIGKGKADEFAVFCRE